MKFTSLWTVATMVGLMTSIYGLPITLQQTPTSLPYADTAIFNNNMTAIENFQLTPDTGRVATIMVEPVKDSSGDIDPTASGAALTAALTKAGSAKIPVTLLVDTGTYSVSNVSVPTNVSLEGQNTFNTIIEASSMSVSAPTVSSLTLSIPSITVATTSALSNVVIKGGVALNGGTVSMHNVTITSKATTGITVNKVTQFTLDNVTVDSSTIALSLESTAKGLVKHSQLSGANSVVAVQNAPVVFIDNQLLGAPKFFGTASSSAQHCQNNVDVSGNIYPAQAMAVPSSLCVPATLTASGVLGGADGQGLGDGSAGAGIKVVGGVPPYKISSASCTTSQLSLKPVDVHYFVAFSAHSLMAPTSTCTVTFTDSAGKQSNVYSFTVPGH